MKATRETVESSASRRVGEKETGRVEAFSDGVFAIAITLLILSITVPTNTSGDLLVKIAMNWPSFLAYALSFVTILIMWVNHHNLFRLIRRTDQAFLMINGLLLMLVTFVNYPTALIADSLQHPGDSLLRGSTDQRAAAAIYSATFVVISIFYNVLWHYAKRDGRLLAVDRDASVVGLITRQYSYGPLFYGIALALALVSAPASILMNCGLAVYFMFTGTERNG